MTEKVTSRTLFGSDWQLVPATDAIREHWVPADGTKVEVYLQSDGVVPIDMVCYTKCDGREEVVQLGDDERSTFAYAEGVRITLMKK